MKKGTTKKKETVDQAYKRICAEGQVLIEGRCSDIVMLPKERKVQTKELDSCRIKMPKVDVVEERAKQRLLKELYKDEQVKFGYFELAGKSREEIQTKEA